jgi:hypothetical protein
MHQNLNRSQILHDKRVVVANLVHRCTCTERSEIISRYTSEQFCAHELCMLLLGMLLGGVHMRAGACM